MWRQDTQIHGHKSTVTVFEKKGLVNCTRTEFGDLPEDTANPALTLIRHSPVEGVRGTPPFLVLLSYQPTPGIYAMISRKAAYFHLLLVYQTHFQVSRSVDAISIRFFKFFEKEGGILFNI